MSICRGIAGRRGKNPVGIFIHNGADSQNATAEYYKNYLQTWKMDLLIIMCAAMESYRRKMTKIALGTADT